MLRFSSSQIRDVNAKRGVEKCLAEMFPDGIPSDCRLILFDATIGHSLDRIGKVLAEKVPGVPLLGMSGMGVIGPQGPGESLHEIGIMAICGPAEEMSSATATDVHFENSYEKSLEMLRVLKAGQPDANAVFLICPLPDINNLDVLRAFDEVFGDGVILFGGNSCDSSKVITSYQYHDGSMGEHELWAVAFGDPTLRAVSRASHGNKVFGLPMTVTKAEGKHIIELNGKPAYGEYQARIDPSYLNDINALMTSSAVAQRIDPALEAEYESPYLIRAVNADEAGNLYYRTDIQEGTDLWFVLRDEDLIFGRQERALEKLRAAIGDGTPIAVLQMDCAVRGRLTLDRIAKDEFIGLIQQAFARDGKTPPWFGIYCGGEFAPVAGVNQFHSYTTSLLVLYRP